jgi:hypothetical protein
LEIKLSQRLVIRLFQRGFIQAVIILSLLGSAALLAACSPQKATPPTMIDLTEEEQTGGKKNQDCPQLDSRLYELSLMESPLPTAEQWGFRVKDGKVFVLLVLTDEKTQIPEGFDLEVGTRSGSQVQVFAPLTELCDLANSDEVIAVRQPSEPVLE